MKIATSSASNGLMPSESSTIHVAAAAMVVSSRPMAARMLPERFRELAHQVYFTDGGVLVEHGPPKQFFANPRDPRTRQFLDQIL